MAIDYIIMSGSVMGFIIFIVIQLIYFRFTEQKNVIKSLKIALFLAGIVMVLICGGFYYYKWQILVNYSIYIYILACVLSVIIYCMLVYLYSHWIFGVYESSITVRLLRELASAENKGLRLSQIMEEYNEDIIIQRRLSRLISSGEIYLNSNGKYCIRRKYDIFRIQSYIIYKLKGFIEQR
jgi:hypothetical protein